jgi:hypothetical protein
MELRVAPGNKIGTKLDKLLGNSLGNSLCKVLGNSLGNSLGSELGKPFADSRGISFSSELGVGDKLGSELNKL